MLCISISSTPGKFGTVVHNAAYRALGLDWAYIACSVSDLRGAMQGIRALGIRGCSVSMPFKENVIKYLDKIDRVAEKIGAVNTIVNKKGKLIGYNTDFTGAKESLKLLSPKKDYNFLVLGSGGASRAVLAALDDLGFKQITISSRNFLKTKKLSQKFNTDVIKWKNREDCKNDVLINATPIGMIPNINSMPVSKKYIKTLKMVMDVISNPPQTRLIKNSKSIKIKNSDGFTMSLFQAMAQFKLYTGVNPPLDVITNAAKKLYRKKYAC